MERIGLVELRMLRVPTLQEDELNSPDEIAGIEEYLSQEILRIQRQTEKMYFSSDMFVSPDEEYLTPLECDF